MSLTVPQILMLSHAAKVNHERMQERIEWEREDEEKLKELNKKDPITKNGKRMSELGMDDLLAEINTGAI